MGNPALNWVVRGREGREGGKVGKGEERKSSAIRIWHIETLDAAEAQKGLLLLFEILGIPNNIIVARAETSAKRWS